MISLIDYQVGMINEDEINARDGMRQYVCRDWY